MAGSLCGVPSRADGSPVRWKLATLCLIGLLAMGAATTFKRGPANIDIFACLIPEGWTVTFNEIALQLQKA